MLLIRLRVFKSSCRDGNDMVVIHEKRMPEWNMQALTAESNRVVDAIFTNRVQGEAKRRKENASNSARTRPDCWQERCLNKCKAMPDSEEKYQKLKELAESFQDKKELALALQDFDNASDCDFYLQTTQEPINALSPEYEEAERARMIEQANREREELRALRPAPSFLVDPDQQFARGTLSREKKETA